MVVHTVDNFHLYFFSTFLHFLYILQNMKIKQF